MSHILFAVKRSELLELDTTMTHLSTWIFTSILISMWNKGSSTSFQPPHFFPTCLKHNSRKLGKKNSKHRRNPRQSYRPNSTPWGWGWIWISWIRLCCKCPRSRPIPLSIPKIPKKNTLFKRPLTLPFWFEGLGTICWCYFFGDKNMSMTWLFFSLFFFDLFWAWCLGEDILSQIFRKHIFRLSFFDGSWDITRINLN